MRKTSLVLGLCVFSLGARAMAQPQPARNTALRFEVTLAPGVLSHPVSGRVLVALSTNLEAEPRLSIGQTGLKATRILGADADKLYLGLNRTIFTASRSGTGVNRACIFLSTSATPSPATIASECAF